MHRRNYLALNQPFIHPFSTPCFLTNNEVFLLFVMTFLSQNLKFTVMKKLIKSTACLIILLLGVSVTSSGQEYIKLERSKTLQLSNESSENEIIVKVTDEYNYLRIKTEGEFTKGSILIELIDPSGNISRNFTIDAGNNDSAKVRPDRMGAVSGQMQKAFRNPDKGNWLVRITPGEATGNLRIYSIEIYNPRTDLIELEQIEKDTDEHIR